MSGGTVQSPPALVTTARASRDPSASLRRSRPRTPAVSARSASHAARSCGTSTTSGRWSDARISCTAATLKRRGVLTTLRQSAGQDVEAGCGQLRARAATGRRIPIAST